MKIKIIFLVAVLAGILTTCKKYPEGPLFSLRTKERRVIGSWTCQKYLIDGADSTSIKFPNSQCTADFFGKVGAGSIDNYHFVYDCNSTAHLETGKWYLDGDKKSIVVSGTVQGTNLATFILADRTSWTILKLKHAEMHLQTDFNSKHYDAYLKRQE